MTCIAAPIASTSVYLVGCSLFQAVVRPTVAVENNSLLFLATARVMSCAMRTLFGCESSQLSFFYFLYYCAQAGGVNRLIDHQPGDAQQSRVQVRCIFFNRGTSYAFNSCSVLANPDTLSVKGRDPQRSQSACSLPSILKLNDLHWKFNVL